MCPSPPGINNSSNLFIGSYITFLVLDNCPSVELVRRKLGIRSFLDSCLGAGRSRAKAYRNYLMGQDKDNIKVDLKSHLARGAHLQELTDAWLETWEERSD